MLRGTVSGEEAATYFELNLRTYNENHIKRKITPMYTACHEQFFSLSPVCACARVHTHTKNLL